MLTLFVYLVIGGALSGLLVGLDRGTFDRPTDIAAFAATWPAVVAGVLIGLPTRAIRRWWGRR